MRYLSLILIALLAACEGPAGAPGESCSVADNGDGTKTVTCPGSSPVTIANGDPGADGTSCTIADNGDGTATISCTDDTSVTITQPTSCAVADNGDGTKTISCPGSAPVTVSDGSSCSVINSADGTSILSCTDGSRVVIAQPIDTSLTMWDDLPGVSLDILALGDDYDPGDTIAMTFRVETTAGRILPIGELDLAGVWLAGPIDAMQHVLPAARDQEMFDLTGATLNDDGSYTYTFPAAIPTSFGVPLYDTTKFTEGELTGALTTGTYRIAMTASKDYTIDGQTYHDANSTSHDFGVGTTTLDTHEVVADTDCASCHEQLQMHDGKFRSAAVCATCHTAGAEDVGSTNTGDATASTIELKVMIHKLHNGSHLPSVQGLTTDAGGGRVYATGSPYLVGASDFSAVNYPAFPNFNIAMPKDVNYSLLSSTNKTKEDNVRKGVTDCASCHENAADGANAYAVQSRRACGSCHDDVDWAKPYTSNGSTMPASASEANCTLCHTTDAVQANHLHPVLDPAVTPDIQIHLLGFTGGTGAGGKILAGDPLGVTFSIEDAIGDDLPINYLDSMTMTTVGPTQARQIVIPGQPGGPADFAGRLAAASTTNKGSMSKVYTGGTTTSEVLTVEFSSATAFTVTGRTSGALTSGTLPGSPGTFPSGASIGNIILGAGAIAQNITVTFSTSTQYSVTGSVSGAMGSGVLPAATSNTQRFTSTDGTVSFNVVVGTSAAATNNSFYISVVKGSATNPVMFAVVGGRTAFAATDRFYYEYIAPAATYALPVHMDLYNEYLGDASGSAGQTFTAANLPMFFGRQTLMERTATPGTVMTTTGAASMMGRYLYVNALDAGLAANDFIVIDDGMGNEEYAKVGSVDAATQRIALTAGGGSSGYSANPLRYAHAIGATVQEVTLTYRQEGASNYYTLDPTTGVITINGATTAGNAFVMTYRAQGRFGWKRKLGDTQAPFYYANLADDPETDETWGDWRGKPIVDGTYTLSIWATRNIEHKSGIAGAYEWQTYRATSGEATSNFLYGASSTTIVPYDKIDDTDNCHTCHGEISFHGGSRSGGDTCMMCHGTPGEHVHFRTLAHEFHVDYLPVFPNGAGQCAKCHGTHDVTQPTSRNHPTAQVEPSRDWTRPCTGCHTSTAAEAHADTMTSEESGNEACAVCHDPDREYAVEQVHMAR